MIRKISKRLLSLFIIAALLFAAPICVSAASEEDGMMRIKLTRPGTLSQLTLSLTCAYVIAQSGERLEAGSTVTAAAKDGAVELRVGDSVIVSGEKVELFRCGNDLRGFAFAVPALENTYCGDLSLTASGDTLTPILTVYIEDYLYGVTAAAMPFGTSAEAMKAQAVAARSYALCKRASMTDSDYDATDSSADQLYNGYDPARSDAVTCVDETRGQVLFSDGAPAACYVTQSNGGQTESAENVWGTPLSYSVVKDDSCDAGSADAAVKSVTLKKDGSNITAQMRSALIESMADQLEGWGLSTSDADITITSVDSLEAADPEYEGGTLYRRLDMGLSVRSVNLTTGKPVNCSVNVSVPTYGGFEDWYDLSINETDNETVAVSKVNGDYEIRFRREGHGIGLSRCGAQVMASDYGKAYTNILEFYYPGTELQTVTLTRADNGASDTGTETLSRYALPTLVPRATAEPTAEPTEAVVWTTPEPTAEPVTSTEPESTGDVPPLFKISETETPQPVNSFIAGNAVPDDTADTDPEEIAVAAETEPAATATPVVPLQATTKKPEATEAPQSGKETPLPDVISADGLDFDNIGDLDLDVSDGSALGDLATEAEPGTGSSAKATEAPSSIENIPDLSDSGNYLDTDVDEDAVLGAQTDAAEEDTEEVTAAEDTLKQAKSLLYGRISVEEGSSLTLREQPSATSAAIGWIGGGEIVLVTAYSDTWLYVETADGKNGYVSRDYVVKVSADEAQSSGWSTDSGEDEGYPTDDGTTDDGSSEAFNDLQSSSVDIVICDFNAVTTSKVNMRQEPSTTALVLGTLAAGETVHVTAYSTDWAYVEYAGYTGYIARSYLKKV